MLVMMIAAVLELAADAGRTREHYGRAAVLREPNDSARLSPLPPLWRFGSDDSYALVLVVRRPTLMRRATSMRRVTSTRRDSFGSLSGSTCSPSTSSPTGASRDLVAPRAAARDARCRSVVLLRKRAETKEEAANGGRRVGWRRRAQSSAQHRIHTGAGKKRVEPCRSFCWFLFGLHTRVWRRR